MNNGKYVKIIKHKRNDAILYVAMQCIVSFFIIIYINLTKQVDNYLDIYLNFWIFFRTIIIFLIIKLFDIKCEKFSQRTLYILAGCFLFDFFLQKLRFTDNPLFFNFITLSSGAYLPLFILSICKKFYSSYNKLCIGRASAKKILYYKYCTILMTLLLLNFIIPFLIFSLFFIADLEVLFVIFVLYQLIFSKFMPLITFFISIHLQHSIFYRKKIAPNLIYLIIFGGIFDIILYTQFSYDLFQTKDNLSIPISFIATFLPMLVAYKLSIIYAKIKKTKISSKQ